MNKVQKLYLIIATLLGFGVPLLFIGLQVPSAMHASILANAAEYSILDEEDSDFWASVPGRTGMQDVKRFYLFECTNAEQVALVGEEPRFVETGPFAYWYTHSLEERGYSEDDDKVLNTRVSFLKKFQHTYMGDKNKLKNEHRVINLSGLKRWNNVKKKERFQIAIEGFFETFQYSEKNLLRDLIIREIIKLYQEHTDEIYKLTEGLDDVDEEVRSSLAFDELYGLIKDFNVYEWSFMCDSEYPYIEHEILNYFGFSMSSYKVVKKRFCQNYDTRWEAQKKKTCAQIAWNECTGYNISFHQWMYANVTASYANTTFKKLHGVYEFHNYIAKFMDRLQDRYKEQFGRVSWSAKQYNYLLDTRYQHPNTPTNPSSILLFENMRKLFSAGMATANPFKPPGDKSPTSHTVQQQNLDLSRFDEVAQSLKMERENAFMLYAYFEHYVNNTVLLVDLGGSQERERIGNYGAAVLRDIAEYFRDFIDLLIYSFTLYNKNPGVSCEGRVKEYFTMTETIPIMDGLVKAICTNKNFVTDLNTPLGWKYFIESSAYPYANFYTTLKSHFQSSIPDFKENMLDAMIYGKESRFYKVLSEVKTDVKKHYNSVAGGKACENELSPYCTKRQLFVTQLYQAVITSNPYPPSGLPRADSIADWWRLIKPYIENVNATEPFDAPLPDLPIEVPVEIPFLRKYYNKEKFDKKEIYQCLNYIKLFDTDVIYDLFLRIQGDKPKECASFADYFFYNSTRYWIRNVHFGPMFKRLYPEEVFFGYYDNLLHIEHDRTDYLKGDDCTLNPSIGYNPKYWATPGDATFNHFSNRHRMRTGTSSNVELRSYIDFYGNDYIAYRRLRFDESGDECYFVTREPFRESVAVRGSTDGLQFGQYRGKSPKGHKLQIIEPNVYRPMSLVRKTDYSYDFFKTSVNTYLLKFENDILCPDGAHVTDGFDMTSFHQLRSVVTMPRFENISKSGFVIPQHIDYRYPLDKDFVPRGYGKAESYFMVEPYTGITVSFKKKMMFSVLLYFDDLYKGSSADEAGVFLPSYAMYETSDVHEHFINDIQTSILSSHITRVALIVTFCVLGGVLLVAGVGLIIRSCFLRPEEISEVSESLVEDKETVVVDAQLARVNAEVAPMQDEGEDLQQEPRNTELKLLELNEEPINSSIIQVPESKDPSKENLLP